MMGRRHVHHTRKFAARTLEVPHYGLDLDINRFIIILAIAHNDATCAHWYANRRFLLNNESVNVKFRISLLV
jgi:hypothetical protein